MKSLPPQQSLRSLLTSPPFRAMTLRLRTHTTHTLLLTRTTVQALITERPSPTLTSPRHTLPTTKSPGQAQGSRKTGKWKTPVRCLMHLVLRFFRQYLARIFWLDALLVCLGGVGCYSRCTIRLLGLWPYIAVRLSRQNDGMRPSVEKCHLT